MMRILHTADWHIDAPLREYSDLQRRELRASLLEIPGAIAELCIRERCDLVLLSGDIFDGPCTREGYEAVYRALERMAVPVFVAPGSRDPYRAGSPWADERWPDNVYLFKYPEVTAYTIRELDCRIYGAAFTGGRSPALLRDFRAECAERHALLVLHGDPLDPDSPRNPVTAAQIREAGVDYAALGGVHAPGRFEAGAGVCAWPGCPMGRGFSETGTKGVLIAEVDEAVYVRFLPLSGPRFFEYTVEALDDPEGAVASVLPAAGSRDHYRIHVTGQTRDGSMNRLSDRFAAWPNLTILDETTPMGDVWQTAREDSVTGLFFRNLQDQARSSEPGTAELLELAARIGRRILDGQEVELP